MKKIFFLLLIVTACNDDDTNEELVSNCDDFGTELTVDEYEALGDFSENIVDVEIEGDCLQVTVSDSGCDDSWPVNLHSPDVFISIGLIPNRPLKINIDNNQVCLAVFQKTVSFDLTAFQLDYVNQLTLNIEGWDEGIIYEY